MSQKINPALRPDVATRAKFCCEYCLAPEIYLATTFHIDHIRSIKHRGKTVLSNLAFTCPPYNQNKGTDVATYVDEDENSLTRLFNPRKDFWNDHFEINEGWILAKSKIGTATIQVLDMNQIERVLFRRQLTIAGFYPLS